MRLWTIHPRYLDSRGLVALWRESLLARAVLRSQTRGYATPSSARAISHASESPLRDQRVPRCNPHGGNGPGLPIRRSETGPGPGCSAVTQPPPGNSYTSGSTCYVSWRYGIRKCATGGVVFASRDAIRSSFGPRDRRSLGSGSKGKKVPPGAVWRSCIVLSLETVVVSFHNARHRGRPAGESCGAAVRERSRVSRCETAVNEQPAFHRSHGYSEA